MAMNLKPNESFQEYKKRVIDIKSSSWCAAKYYNATIWLGSGMTTSCHHPLPHKVEIEEIEKNPKALHNTLHKKNERAQMVRGDRPSGCEYCWKVEDLKDNSVSDRVYKTAIYTDADLQQAFETSPDADFDLKTLEISFDRTCQFACSYCNPAFSSTWAKDIKKNGAYNGLTSDGRNHFTHEHKSSQLFTINQNNPYVEAFFKWWDSDLHRTLQELRITGGEPLMSGYTWKLIDWFESNQGKSNTKLAINSNLGYDTEKLEEFLEKTKHINHLEIYTSNESIKSHSEYIRDGIDYDQWLKNLERLIQTPHIKATHVMCTINALCLDSLDKFLDQILDLKKKYGRSCTSYTLNILRFPSFQSPTVLSKELKNLYASNLENWLNSNKDSGLLHHHEIEHTIRLIKYLTSVESPHSGADSQDILKRDFKRFYKQYDIRRQKSFENTFSNELVAWFGEIEE